MQLLIMIVIFPLTLMVVLAHCMHSMAIKFKFRNSAHADGGPRSRVCTRETLCSGPHQCERTFFAARVCRVAFKHLPQPLRSHVMFIFFIFSYPLCHSAVKRGVTDILFILTYRCIQNFKILRQF